jgi:hypothetical protein
MVNIDSTHPNQTTSRLTKDQKDMLCRLAYLARYSPDRRTAQKAKDMIWKLRFWVLDHTFPQVHRCALCEATTDNLLRDHWTPYGVIASYYGNADPARIDGPVCPKYHDEDPKPVLKLALSIIHEADRAALLEGARDDD